ncbi:MAG TPA: hypothetical protein VMI53_14365 [Opitutaceae bacterium]|nr:hypothetical protein [Opitutaceae bacterium]
MKRAIYWLAAVLFLACLTLAYLVAHQKIEIVRVTKEAALAGMELAQAKTEVTQEALHRQAAEKEAQKQILILQQQLAAAKAAEVRAEKQLALAASPGGDTKADGATVIHLSDIMKDHPEYAALYAKETRRGIDRMYGDTLNALNLSSQQLSQLKDLLAERQMSDSDAQGLTSAAGLKPGSSAWQEAMKQASQDLDQQIDALLEKGGNVTLEQLQTQAMIKNKINYTYAPDFAEAGVSLNPEQSRNLTQAIAAADYSVKNPSPPPKGYYDVDPTTKLSPRDNRLLESVAGVLSPAQIQILKTDRIAENQSSAIMKQYYAKGNGTVMIVP